jgi:hypothetical protein
MLLLLLYDALKRFMHLCSYQVDCRTLEVVLIESASSFWLLGLIPPLKIWVKSGIMKSRRSN